MKKFTGAILVVVIILVVGHIQRGQSPFLRGTGSDLKATDFSINSIHSNSAPTAILLGQKIDLNSATKDDLEALPGIGPSLAERIVKYRDLHGRFKTIDGVDGVSGIGPKTVERLREFLKEP